MGEGKILKLKKAKIKEDSQCEWSNLVGQKGFSTSCGYNFLSEKEGNLQRLGYRFCVFCGRPITPYWQKYVYLSTVK